MLLNHSGTLTIQTQRLILRKFELSDANSVYNNWMNDPEVQGNYGETACADLIDAQKAIGAFITKYANDDYYRWIICLKENNESIGQIALYIVDSKNLKTDVEYCIGQAYRGHGLAAEALQAVIKYVFEHVGFNRIQALHRSKNASSGRVLQKAGLKYEGTMKQYLIYENEFDDCILYALIRQDWTKK